MVGRRYSSGNTYDPAADYEIVGVVSNASYSQVRGDFPRTAYVPFTANRGVAARPLLPRARRGDPLSLAASVRTVGAEARPRAGHRRDGHDDESQVGDSLWQEQLFARLTAMFSLLALTLACVGLYGTISYGVGRRRSEIAVRMALGARYWQVLWMILRQALVLALAGVFVGVPLALWTSTYISDRCSTA